MVEQTLETRAWKALRGIEPEWADTVLIKG
jgi:hypothetical protein